MKQLLTYTAQEWKLAQAIVEDYWLTSLLNAQENQAVKLGS